MSTEWGRDQNEAAAEEAAEKQRQAISAREDALLRVLAESVASVIERDPHQWSTRPCPSCRVISGLLGRLFGCDKYRAEKLSTTSAVQKG
jgi:hypothetical protein